MSTPKKGTTSMSTFHEDEGVREILRQMGMTDGEKEPPTPGKSSGMSAGDALILAVDLGLDPDDLIDALHEQGRELYEFGRGLPMGDRIAAAARRQATENALLEGRYDDMLGTAGGDANLMNQVVADNVGWIDQEDLADWAGGALLEMEAGRQGAIGQAYADAVKARPELETDPVYASLLQGADWSQVQSGDDAKRAIEALTRVGDEVKRRQDEADLNAALLKAAGVTDVDGEDMFGKPVDLPTADLDALLDAKQLARIMEGDKPRPADASDETITKTFAAVESADDEWNAFQKAAADSHASQLAREARIGGHETRGGRNLEEDWS
jgi:hypothetical protein